MRYLFSVLVTLAWGLWFGGLIALFLIVTRLFKTFSTQPLIFGQAGSATFQMFERYQLCVAAAGLLFTVLWTIAAPAKAKNALFTLFAVAAVGAIYVMVFITPRLELLRLDLKTATPEFRELHGLSMMLYMGQAIVLLGAALVLPLGYRSDARLPGRKIESN